MSLIHEELSRKIIGGSDESAKHAQTRTRSQSGRGLHRDHTAQMTGYLAITGLNLAILINFKNAQLEGKRIVHQDTQNTQTRVSHGFDGWSKILIRSIRVIRG